MTQPPVRTRWRRTLPWGGGVFIAVVLALAAYDMVRSYGETVRNTGRELDAQVRMVAEQTARSMQAVDVVLRHLTEQSRLGVLAAMNDQSLHAYLSQQAVGLIQGAGLAVLNADGQWRATSAIYPLPEPVPDSAGLELFQVHRGTCCDIGLYIGEANPGQLDGVWVFPITRRLESASGEFAGIVGVRGRVDYFQEFYRDIRLDPGTTIALVHRSGSLLARYPAHDTELGKQFPTFQQLLAARATAQEPLRTSDPIDGIDRFGAYQSVLNYPLAVIVTREARVALAPWRDQAVGTGVRTLALSALAVGLIVVLLRHLRRLDAAHSTLETSQERYALAVAGSNDGIWDHDLIARRVFVSARARELSGMPPGPEDVPLDDWFAMILSSVHPDDVPRRAAAMQAHLEGKSATYACELRHRDPSGRYRWVRVQGLCLRDVRGVPYRMAGSVSDIDERKQAEESLRQSEQRFSLAVTGSNDGILDWDIVADRMYASERASHIAGVGRDFQIGTRAQWLASLQIHPDDRARHDEDFRRHLEGDTQVREGDYRVRHPDGEYRWVRIRGTCFRHAEGHPIRWAGSVTDIDSQKRTEEALRRSDERYQLAVDGANQGLWDWDLVRNTLYLSARAQELMGLTPGEPLRTRREWIALSTYHDEDVPAVRAAIAAHLRGAAPYLMLEYRLRHPSGAWHWYRQRGIVSRDEGGKPYRMAGSMEDITEGKRAEQERAQLEHQLLQAKKLEAIGTLAGGIAHDFNNILAAILGNGEMAQSEAAEGTALRRHVDAVVSAGMRAKSLVERILAFSRSGIGDRVPVHVQSVVEEALDLVASSLSSRIHLERAMAAGDARVLADATQIHQVLMNLCTNGVQAMKAAGTLSVSLDMLDKAGVHVATSSLASGRYVRLQVRDTGAGIEPAALERIFDPFFTTKDVGVGTGLGLSLVHGIVTDLGGGIDVQSEPGRGTTFTVYLPWHSTQAATADAEEEVPDGNGETILLVDDEEPLVRMGEEMLARMGYEPVGFLSSTTALQEFRATPERFHAVITDQSMPDLSGTELAAQMRLIRSDIPIVLVSGFIGPTLAARMTELGVTEVLSKPLIARDIARSLAAALRRHQSARAVTE